MNFVTCTQATMMVCYSTLWG